MKPSLRSAVDWRLATLAFFIFVILFIYSALNLKHIDLGYRQHELLQQEKTMRIEIDRLDAQKASLLNLERMEKTVIEKLGYQYPAAGQIIKVVVAGDEN